MNLTKILLPLGLVSALLSSCLPYPPNPNNPIAAQSPDPLKTVGTSDTVTSKPQKEIRKKRSEIENASNPPELPPAPDPNTPPPKKDFRSGVPIPGKDGFVFNPFTNNPVDVRGIPPGTLVRDPQDTNPDHKFRVP